MNGVSYIKTDKQAETLSAALHELYEKGRKVELQKILNKHEQDALNLPEIFKIRIKALQEVNTEYFKTSPELILANCAATYFIRNYFKDFDKIPDNLHRTDMYKKAHSIYGLEPNSDVNPFLVLDLVYEYCRDVKSGIIDKKGNLIGDLKQSNVMEVVHDSKEYGIPKNAHIVVNAYLSKTK